MLVLTRKANEAIETNGAARIVVLSISGGQVKLGIEADSNVAIWRDELRDEFKNVIEPAIKKTIKNIDMGGGSREETK